MTERTTLLRGRTLDFVAEPQGPDDCDAFQYCEDGAILIEDGLILDCGDYQQIRQRAAEATVIDHRPHLLMAGFIDAHLHFPQVQILCFHTLRDFCCHDVN